MCVSLCLSVKSHLTSGASVRPEITVADSAGNGFSLKLLRSRAKALPALYGYCEIGHVISAEYARELAIIIIIRFKDINKPGGHNMSVKNTTTEVN